MIKEKTIYVRKHKTRKGYDVTGLIGGKKFAIQNESEEDKNLLQMIKQVENTFDLVQQVGIEIANLIIEKGQYQFIPDNVKKYKYRIIYC